tara:strand:+ start:62893 stop:64464 length:1572 start_codon:yes stop_codon:yes gene_type:complete
MRIATLGISHETNTFSTIPATYEEFEKKEIKRKQEIIKHFEKSNYTIAGYIEASKIFDFELVPLMYANTGPIGIITKEAYKRLSNEMLEMLKNDGPWDGVLIANHGAAVSEEYPDMDADFTKKVREIVGIKVPVGITLDMHANISKDTVENTDVCIVWRTCPHLDAKPRALKCAELIVKAIKKEIIPTQFIETPPMLVNIVKQFTGQEPMKGLVEDCIEANLIEKVLDTSISEGYPYADVIEMGMSWITITDNNIDLAKEISKKLSKKAWGKREELNKPVPTIDESLKIAKEIYIGPKPKGKENFVPNDGQALEESKENDHSHLGPIVLMDVGDNIGGGSTADSTHILKRAKELNIKDFLQSLCDPDVVNQCVSAGEGSHISISVGGKIDQMHGSPINLQGTIKKIDGGKYEEHRPNHGGFRYFDDGKRVRFDTDDGMTILITSKRSGNTAREQMYSMGIYPENYKIVVAKGVSSPRPAYQPIAAEIILVNSPGVTTSDLSFFEYKNIRKNLYPFDKNTKYLP